MTRIIGGFLPPQALQNIKADPKSVATIKAAAEQKGSEIVFKDQNNEVQTATLDEYLNNPELSKFQGAKSATLTLEVGKFTILIDVKELNQENLLNAVTAALTNFEAKGHEYTEQFRTSAKPIFDSIKPRVEHKGIDEATRQSLRKEPVPQTIGSSTKNFLDVLSPLDSPGDSIDIQLEASASLKLWGPLGIEASGNAGINVSIDDDGLLYVKFTANADVGATLGGKVKGAEVEGKAAVGVGVGVVYRFKNAEQVNQFLLQKFNDALPETIRKEFLPGLEKNTHDVNVRPTTIQSAFGKLEAKVEIGDFSAEASFETRTSWRSFYSGSGDKVVSEDYKQTASVSLSLGSVTLSGSYSEFTVQKDNISENTGSYKAIEGTLSFSLSQEELGAFRQGRADHIRAHIEKAANNLGLSGESKAKFISGVLARAQSKIEALEGKQTNSASVTIGVAIQAQWEKAEAGGSGELQYLRLGTTRSVSSELDVSIGIAEASLKGSASVTDLTDIKIGTEDETYLAGLYKYNREAYEKAKAQLGGDETQVSSKLMAEDQKTIRKDENGNEMTVTRSLKEWESIWNDELNASNTVETVEMSTNKVGKAQFLLDFVTQNFGALDSNNNKFIYTTELQDAIKSATFSKPEEQEALQTLLDNIGTIEEYSNDETWDENDGITLEDLKAYVASIVE